MAKFCEIFSHSVRYGFGTESVTSEYSDQPFTLYILMDFPMQFDRISMELSILYFDGHR